MQHQDDTFWEEALAQGNREAYAVLFKKYYRMLVLEAFYYLKDEMEAEDLVQSIFIEIWNKQLYRNIKVSLKSYLHTSVRNRSFGLLEKKKTAKKRLDAYTYHLEQVTSDDRIGRKESEKIVRETLEELSLQRSKAFTLVYLEDKRYSEAALEMGISVNSLKTHLKLAVKSLQQKFSKARK
ncbi:sigma-70 family RNA polymerase sigma factor [Niabella sp. CC-SYL272]|uniref:RNA polymerase sigma factor n=1 Tax=Niabella agricola TaxID=2891571 RepID=UPI001F48B78E|nr:sigma-70 family RNA polymerase sigma factor [Niabella agricola]MCF3111259.1 sigma-70 family RNA polymerase sigma factor [Niabella agricola]